MSKKFCELLKIKREKKGLTKKQAAEFFGWSPMYYGRYENGHLLPTNRNIKTFSKFLNISEKELSDIVEEEKNELDRM